MDVFASNFLGDQSWDPQAYDWDPTQLRVQSDPVQANPGLDLHNTNSWDNARSPDSEEVLYASIGVSPMLWARDSSSKTVKLPKGPLNCQVEGCGKDLNIEKGYYQRYRVCAQHLKMLSLMVDGKASRFCQQCGRFHELHEFDKNKRSCRARLQQHNARRRKRIPSAKNLGPHAARKGKVKLEDESGEAQQSAGCLDLTASSPVVGFPLGQTSGGYERNSVAPRADQTGKDPHTSLPQWTNPIDDLDLPSSLFPPGYSMFPLQPGKSAAVSDQSLSSLPLESFCTDTAAPMSLSSIRSTSMSMEQGHGGVQPASTMFGPSRLVMDANHNANLYAHGGGMHAGVQQEVAVIDQILGGRIGFNQPFSSSLAGPCQPLVPDLNLHDYSVNSLGVRSFANMQDSGQHVSSSASVPPMLPMPSTAGLSGFDLARMIVAGGASNATYHSEEAMVRVSMKIANCTPDQLPPDLYLKLKALLVSADATFVQGFLRPGCTHLVLDIAQYGNSGAATGLKEQNSSIDEQLVTILGPELLSEDRSVLLQRGQHVALFHGAQLQCWTTLAAVSDSGSPVLSGTPAALQLGHGSAVFYASGRSLAASNVKLFARFQGGYLPLECCQVSPATGQVTSCTPESQVYQLAVHGVPNPGLLVLEVQHGCLLTDYKPILLLDDASMTQEMLKLSRCDNGAVEQFTVDLGRLLDFTYALHMYGGSSESNSRMCELQDLSCQAGSRALEFCLRAGLMKVAEYVQSTLQTLHATSSPQAAVVADPVPHEKEQQQPPPSQPGHQEEQKQPVQSWAMGMWKLVAQAWSRTTRHVCAAQATRSKAQLLCLPYSG